MGKKNVGELLIRIGYYKKESFKIKISISDLPKLKLIIPFAIEGAIIVTEQNFLRTRQKTQG